MHNYLEKDILYNCHSLGFSIIISNIFHFSGCDHHVKPALQLLIVICQLRSFYFIVNMFMFQHELQVVGLIYYVTVKSLFPLSICHTPSQTTCSRPERWHEVNQYRVSPGRYQLTLNLKPLLKTQYVEAYVFQRKEVQVQPILFKNL